MLRKMKFALSMSLIILFLGTVVVGAGAEDKSAVIDKTGMKTFHGAMKVDIAMYTDETWWIPKELADEIGEQIKEAVEPHVKSIDFVSKADLPQWIQQNMGDGEIDIIILFGDFPETIYPAGNVQPDGSLAEQFLEDGNMYVNTADWIFYGGQEAKNSEYEIGRAHV